MSEAWSKPQDVDRLADEQTALELAIPLTAFARVQERLAGTDGSLRGSVQFGRESGFPVADLVLAGTVTLICQRCLGSMPWPVESAVRVALIGAQSQSDRVPDNLEPMLAPGGRISLADLVEEELLLSLPIVPLHSAQSQCAVQPPDGMIQEAGEQAVQRPFEQLGELFKRGK